MSKKRASSDRRTETKPAKDRGLERSRKIGSQATTPGGETPGAAENRGGDSSRYTVRRSGCFGGFGPARREGGYPERRRARLSHAGGGHERRRGDSFERGPCALLEPRFAEMIRRPAGKVDRDRGSIAGGGDRAGQIRKVPGSRSKRSGKRRVPAAFERRESGFRAFVGDPLSGIRRPRPGHGGHRSERTKTPLRRRDAAAVGCDRGFLTRCHYRQDPGRENRQLEPGRGRDLRLHL